MQTYYKTALKLIADSLNNKINFNHIVNNFYSLRELFFFTYFLPPGHIERICTANCYIQKYKHLGRLHLLLPLNYYIVNSDTPISVYLRQ